MRKIVLTVAALASLITGAPTPAAAAPAGQAALAAILAMPEAVEAVQYNNFEAQRRFRARQAARRREFRRRQAARRNYNRY